MFRLKQVYKERVNMKYIFLRFPGGKAKAVTLSYDDGFNADIRLSNILNNYEMKCTFNLCSNYIGKGSFLTKEEIQENLIGKGHEIAIHGANHRAPGSQKPIAGIRDVLDCRLELEKTFGLIVRGMAYPDTGIMHFEGNTSYDRIKNYLSDLGIAYARTIGGDNNSFTLPEDWYAWMPTASHLNANLFDYVKEFLDLDIDNMYISKRYPRLFFLWGHSFEFDRLKKWDVIEKFCSEIAKKEDIWYATNIEIFDYVNAYNSLIFSADESIVYNPTLYTIWFDVDKKLYSVKPGETIRIE